MDGFMAGVLVGSVLTIAVASMVVGIAYCLKEMQR